jgi:Cyclic nucleotide-binding domain
MKSGAARPGQFLVCSFDGIQRGSGALSSPTIACQEDSARYRPDVLPLAGWTSRTGTIFNQGEATMPASEIAAVSLRLKSQFLEGLAAGDRKEILAAATPRRFASNSVVTNHGHPADYLFLLTNGFARYFFVTEGKKLIFRWLGPGDLFGGRTVLSTRSSYLVSTETVTHSSVFVWDRPTIRGLVERYPR